MLAQTTLRTILRTGCAGLLLGLLLVAQALGQVAGGTIDGTVTDSTGAVLPDVLVAAKNVATDVGSNTKTNSDGYYSLANLVPGTYTVTLQSKGFAQVIARNVVVNPGIEVTVNLSMRVGATNESVEVTDAAPLVDVSSATLAGVVAQRTVQELPLNGRDWTQLATLEPGVVTVRSQEGLSSERGQRGLGTQLTISGGRPQQNNYRLDGVSINDYSNGGPGSVLGLNLGADAVAEFSVLTSNYSAEYGRTSGGVINAITRSGTNSYHGSGYYFRRDSALDARNYFDGPNKPPFYRHQYGGSIGGPIKKDKTFFFGDYEGINQSLGLTSVDTMPTAAARNGFIHDSKGNPITITVNPLIKPFLTFFPLPNGPAVGPDTAIYTFTGQNNTNEEFLTTRLDHNISNNDKLFGTYMFDQGRTASPDQTNAKVQQFRSRRQLVTLEETHSITQNLMNVARLGLSRIRANIQETVQAINPAAADVSLGTVPGRPAAQISFPGVTPFLGGLGGVPNYNFWWTSIQGYDDAMYSHGKHAVKFGVSVEHIGDNMKGISNPNGVWKFNNLQNFLLDIPKNLSAALPGLISPRNVRQWVVGGYVNDDYHIFQRLTVNLGLRYEMATVPTEVAGKLSTLINLSDTTMHTGDPYFKNPTLRNFEPRVGVSWSPSASGNTVVHAGFGIYDSLPLPYEYELPAMLAAPFFQLGQTPNNLPVGSFPTAGFNMLGTTSFRGAYIQQNPKRNYIYQYNVNVQRRLPGDFTLMLAYVGSRGIHQPFRTDTVNYVLPTGKDSAGNYTWPLPVGSGIPINTHFSRVDGLLWVNDSYYNSGQLQVKKSMSHGFQIQGTYTWGKSEDTGSASLAGDPYANSVPVLPFFDPKLRKGLSDFNISHNAVINMLWMVPGSHSRTGVIGWAANGWQIGTIFNASTGVPITPIIDGDPLGLNSSAFFAFPNVVNSSDCSSKVNANNPVHYIKTQCYSMPAPGVMGTSRRNSIIGPGLAAVDMSFFKNNYVKSLGENFNVQFRADVFNIINRTNFAPPLAFFGNTSLFDQTGTRIPSAGQIVNTQTTSREIQLAIKVIF